MSIISTLFTSLSTILLKHTASSFSFSTISSSSRCFHGTRLLLQSRRTRGSRSPKNNRISMWGEEPFDKKTAVVDDDNDGTNTRRIRKRNDVSSSSSSSSSSSNSSPTKTSTSSSSSSWDSYEPKKTPKKALEPYDYQDRESSSSSSQSSSRRMRRGGDYNAGRSGGGGGGGGGARYNRRGSFNNDFRRYNDDNDDDDDYDETYNNDSSRRSNARSRRKVKSKKKKNLFENKINMQALEEAGFEHLYGLAPVRNALTSHKRDFSPSSDDDTTTESFDDDDDELDEIKRELKPAARFTPYLLIQDKLPSGSGTSRTASKRKMASEIEQLARRRNIPTSYVDKGTLNALSSQRPHQGVVLRTRRLSLTPLRRIPPPTTTTTTSNKRLWLVLDEIVDPQNFGALLRTAHFLDPSLPVVVCRKNSSPPSPTVSAASAGALECHEDIYETSNLPQLLRMAREDGWRVLGASSDEDVVGEDGEERRFWELGREEMMGDEQPTLLVLGSEGSGLRTLVARACTEFVKIGGGGGDDDGVDSLNVSVTGGILLWYLKNQMK